MLLLSTDPLQRPVHWDLWVQEANLLLRKLTIGLASQSLPSSLDPLACIALGRFAPFDPRSVTRRID